MDRKIKRRKFILATGSLLATPYFSRSFAKETKTIYYNSTESLVDSNISAKALKLALSKIGKGYELQPSPVGYPTQASLLNAFRTDGQIDICWVSASNEFWDAALPVMVPIDGGFLSYRLFLINGERQAEFQSVSSINDLRRFIAIQGPGWSDIDIMRNAGITVRTGFYKNLFRMTTNGRADFFPRAAFEAINEQRQYVTSLPNLAVEQNIVLKYQIGLMFFISKARPELQADIMAGLKAAHDDGSYQAMLMTHPNFVTTLSEGHLKQRKLIEISNTLLPPGISEIEDRYWLKI